ncbi:MAG: alpha/beta hydrolase [Betaproteobacteria bacterium]
MPTDLLPSIEVETAPNPSHAVIWLHGLGADGNDFVPVVRELGLTGLAIRFIFPHAPLQAVTINGGYVMRAWYDIGYEDLSLREDEKGVRESEQTIAQIIAGEGERGISPQRVILAGFSQGGAIALQTGLRYPERLGGILALSTYLPLPDKVEAERHDSNRDIPVFMAHGTEDPIVPLKLAQASCTRILSLGYAVEWHEYSMPHAVCPEEIWAVGGWFRRIVEASPKSAQ